MSNSVQAVKDKLKNVSREKNVDFNSVMRFYMYDRFVERLSKSKYKDNFILKGGFYLSKLFGLDNRSTMDIDTAIRKAEFTEENIIKMITEIIDINIDDNTYYVPITKYVNDKREKVKIIIDELSSNYIFEPNLISLLDKNIELISYEIKNDSMILNFNNSIFMDKDSILEEVVYSISYSVFSSYDNVQEVVFKVGEKEICKKSVKNVE